MPIAFAVAVTAGFFLHSRWSFKGHGNRYPGGLQQAKFVGVQASGMVLNAAITWIGTGASRLPRLGAVIARRRRRDHLHVHPQPLAGVRLMAKI